MLQSTWREVTVNLDVDFCDCPVSWTLALAHAELAQGACVGVSITFTVEYCQGVEEQVFGYRAKVREVSRGNLAEIENRACRKAERIGAAVAQQHGKTARATVHQIEATDGRDPLRWGPVAARLLLAH